LPPYEFKPRILPSIEVLRRFYSNLKTTQDKLLFLLYATTGLRKSEVLSLEVKDIDLDNRMIIPNKANSRTKRSWISFFNEETKAILQKYLRNRKEQTSKLFSIENADCFRHGAKITPQILRYWFANKMAEQGVQDRYIDTFCGRTPKSILARHYTDYSPERLKRIYDKANLKVLSS
jgi:integrase